MKIKFVLALFALALFSGVATSAQTAVKIGYTNIDYILSNLPQAAEIQTKLQTEKAQYDKLVQEKVAELQKVYEDYQKNAASMSPVIRADKEKFMQNKQGEIQEFQQNSEVALQRKQQELLSPLLDKIQEAVDAVAKENGYTYVFNSDAGPTTSPIVLVAPDSDNITDLVFKKMGVKTPAEKAAETAKPAATPATTTPKK
ncbi:MAG: OmpH family outer membrane protein [Spirosomataceae bacterium]